MEPLRCSRIEPAGPQTADLLDDAEWDDDRRGALAAATRGVPYRTVWTENLRYPFELDHPYYGLANVDKEHVSGWISRLECQLCHLPGDEPLLVVQTKGEWPECHDDRDSSANVEALAAMTAEVDGDNRLAEPIWSDYHGWRYALPEAGIRRGPLDSAEQAGLYCLGDWVAGEARVHADLENALDVGEWIVHAE